jgi:hypothetical protein
MLSKSTYDEAKSKFDALFKQPLPAVQQVDPTRGQQIVASEYLGVPREKQVIKNTVPPPPKSARERCGLSRRDVVAILDKIETYRLGKKDKPLLPERDTKNYRDLAAGNATVGELAHRYNLSVVAFKILVEEVEKTILDEAAYLRKRCGLNVLENLVLVPDEAEATSATERLGDECRAIDEKSIAASGGASIGGRIVSRGKNSKGNPLALDTFERGGKMTQENPSIADEGSNTSRHVEEDDYSEDSRA